AHCGICQRRQHLLPDTPSTAQRMRKSTKPTPVPSAIVVTTGGSVDLPEFDRFVAVRLLGKGQYSPSGDGFAYIANTTGLPNLWWQPDGGGFPLQLTSLSENRISDFAFSPDGSKIAFLADHHGDEMHQLFVIDTFDGWPLRLTHAPQVQ